MSGKRTDYISWDEYFMGVARLAAMRSKDPSTQVGACIVGNDNRILSIGYNGTPNGYDDELFPWDREGEPLNTKYLYVCHAEMNAIISASRKEMIGSTLYLAGLLAGEEYFELEEVYPCEICLRLIKNAGIDKVVTSNGIIYQRDSQGILRRI